MGTTPTNTTPDRSANRRPSSRPAAPADPGVWPAMSVGLAMVLALIVAVRAPLTTAVVGLVIFGVFHNVFELRYIFGRFGPHLMGRWLLVTGSLLGGIFAFRLVSLAGLSTGRAEILFGYAVLMAGLWLGTSRRQPLILVGSAACLGLALWLSLAAPAYHFVVLSHLHNVVPLFFIWEWSGSLSARARSTLRAASITWVVVIPLLVLVGVFDHSIGAGQAMVSALDVDAERFASSVTIGEASAPLGSRMLTVFAFMQTMHYAIWIWLFPRFARPVTRQFEAQWPLLTQPVVWRFGVLVTTALALLFAIDFFQGRSIYGLVASFHVYVELPLLLALLTGGLTGGLTLPDDQTTDLEELGSS